MPDDPLADSRGASEPSRVRPAQLYMVVERFRDGNAEPVYRRFAERGRLAPEGLRYVASWVDTKLERCYQVMETDDPQLLEDWINNWRDLVEFEVVPVITSAEAVRRVNAGAGDRGSGA